MRLNVRWRRGSSGYLILAAFIAGSVVLSLALSWTTALGRQFDNYAYDFLFRLIQPAPWAPASMILALDEPTLAKYGGNAGIGAAVAERRGVLRAGDAAGAAGAWRLARGRGGCARRAR